MTKAPVKPSSEVPDSSSPIYLIFEESQQDNDRLGEISIQELDEIDMIRQMASEIPDEETPVFFTCT